MDNLTIVFLTVNKVPKEWAKFHRKVLLEAIGDSSLITISKEYVAGYPGKNILQDEEPSASNIYRQMLRAAKLADTPYVAIAEDDTLYHKEHFEARSDTFLYNMSRWGVLSWAEKPVYFYRHRESNSALIAPRELLIECLEQYPKESFGEVGKERVMKKLGLPYKAKRFHSRIPIVNFHHIFAIDKMEQQERKSTDKSLISYEIPYWGKASELITNFK